MRTILAGLACASVLAACSPLSVPEASSFPASSQETVASASNWQAMASDLAAALAPAAGPRATLLRPVPGSAFSSAFADMLATELSARHVSVTMNPAFLVATRVRFEVQVVRNGYNRSKAATLPGAVTEIVLTGAAERGGVDVARATCVYYVRASDVSNYLPPQLAPRTVVVLVQPRPSVMKPSTSGTAPIVNPAVLPPGPPAGRMLVIDRYGEKTVEVGAPAR